MLFWVFDLAKAIFVEGGGKGGVSAVAGENLSAAVAWEEAQCGNRAIYQTSTLDTKEWAFVFEHFLTGVSPMLCNRDLSTDTQICAP